MSDTEDIEEISRAKVNLETSQIPWKELLRFFAGGTVIAVDASLDLVEVALQISLDNKAQVEAWMADGKVGRVSDEQAREWLEADASMWATVVKPWILVQPETPGVQ